MGTDHLELIGYLSATGRHELIGYLSGKGRLEGSLSLGKGAAPPYSGDYEVTPTFEEQTLNTMGKRMNNDVTVHQIPVVRTSNPYGGQTVLIG